MSQQVSVVIEHDGNGYFAYVPELKGCHSQGDTFEEAMSNIKEAISLYMSTMDDDEIITALSKEIYTSTISVNLA